VTQKNTTMDYTVMTCYKVCFEYKLLMRFYSGVQMMEFWRLESIHQCYEHVFFWLTVYNQHVASLFIISSNTLSVYRFMPVWPRLACPMWAWELYRISPPCFLAEWGYRGGSLTAVQA